MTACCHSAQSCRRWWRAEGTQEGVLRRRPGARLCVCVCARAHLLLLLMLLLLLLLCLLLVQAANSMQPQAAGGCTQ